MGDPHTDQDPPPDDQFRYEAKHPDYARHPGKPSAMGPGPARHVLRVARADRRLADPASEVQPTRITGRYQNAGAAGDSAGPAFLLHVNQAGKHIEALLVDVSYGAPRYYRFGGDLLGGGFAVTDADANGGSLKVDGADLLLDYGAASLTGERFRIRERRSTFLDEALEPLIEVYGEAGGNGPVAKRMLEEAERTPLTDAQMRFLAEGLASDRIETCLRAYYENASSTETAARAQSVFTADDFDGQVGSLLSPGRWHRQLETARDYARRLLALQKVAIQHSQKSALQWIEDMTLEAIENLPEIGSSPESRPMSNLRSLVGLVSGAVAKPNQYRLDLSLKHKGVSAWDTLRAELYYGTMTVWSPTAASFRNDPPHTYRVVLVGGGSLLGKGGEAEIKANATFTALGEWTPADFPGDLKLVEGGVWTAKSVKGKAHGVGKRDAALILVGRGNHREIIAPLEGLGARRDGVGAEFALSWGRVLQKGEELDAKDFSRPSRRINYAVEKTDRSETHFILGSALLRSRGTLRAAAAVWLPWLESAESALRIVGQADTVDTPKRNMDLSEMRAKNVKQALKDILGGDLAIPDNKIQVQGLGDVEASRHDLDETPDLKYRRVDVEINGRCVLTLWSS
ncbi:MAG TPA: OmpA family protein [Polyangia bacterium]|nr:OmpA family protein [Polyangia bacterium]